MFSDVFGFMDREIRGYAGMVWDMRLSENSRCVIVMTNLAFAPDGRKSVETVHWVFDM